MRIEQHEPVRRRSAPEAVANVRDNPFPANLRGNNQRTAAVAQTIAKVSADITDQPLFVSAEKLHEMALVRERPSRLHTQHRTAPLAR